MGIRVLLGNLLEVGHTRQVADCKAPHYGDRIHANGSLSGSHNRPECSKRHDICESSSFGLMEKDISNCHFPAIKCDLGSITFLHFELLLLTLLVPFLTQDGCQTATLIYMTFMPFSIWFPIWLSNKLTPNIMITKRVLFRLIRICFVAVYVLIVCSHHRFCDDTDLKRTVATNVMTDVYRHIILKLKIS